MSEITTLEQSLKKLFDGYSQNRTDLEEKWRSNYDMFMRRDEDVERQFKKDEGKDWRCKARLGTTRQKVIHAVAIAADTMLQGGRINYQLEIDPISREELEKAGFPEDYFENGLEKMKARIDDYIAKAHGDRQLLKNLLSGAIYGRTYSRIRVQDYIKSAYLPIPETILEGRPDLLRWAKVTTVEEFPAWEWVSTWDVFTDLEDMDIQHNAGTFIRWWSDPGSLDKLRANKADPTLLFDVLKEASKRDVPSDPEDAEGSQSVAPKYDSLEVTRKNLRMLDFYGFVPLSELKEFLQEKASSETKALFAEYLMAYEELAQDDLDPDVEVILSCVGPEMSVWRMAPGAPEIGRGIFSTPWEDPLDDILDVGVVDNCRDTQQLADGIYRTIIDNQKLSGNVIIGLKEEFLMEPLKELKPGQTIRIDPSCPDVRQAIQQVTVQDITGGLLNAFELTTRMLDDDSAIPRIQQGQEAARMETAFSMSQRLEKSGKYFGQIIRNYDESHIEPIVTWLYNYIMQQPVEFDGKGGYTIQALGFSSFQNRVTRMNGLIQFLNIALAHPEIYRALKFDAMFRELARMLDLDPDTITYSQAEQQARDEAQAKAEQEEAEMERASKEAAIERDRSLATINNTSARIQAEKLRTDQIKTATELLNAEESQQ